MQELSPWLIGLLFVSIVLVYIGSLRLNHLKQRMQDVQFGSNRPSSSVLRIVLDSLEQQQKGWRILVLIGWVGIVASAVWAGFKYV